MVREYDAVGVGLGPFNLGLAALLEPLEDVEAAFFEARPGFSWHGGLMLPDAEIQVPFLADLVTLADPTSAYSFLNYLHAHGRLYRFYFHERLHVLRREFEAYCRWVAERIEICRFGHRVETVRRREDGRWSVAVAPRGGAAFEVAARAVVLGVGTVPALPACAQGVLPKGVLHSADYLGHRDRVLAAPRVAVIGSGQSAAEIVADLLEHGSGRIAWFTRSAGFLPMEYSKLGLEHFSPEYGAYFHGLPPERRDALRSGQDLLYKGISADTSARIYDALYQRTVDGADAGIVYSARCELRRISDRRLGLHHLDQDTAFTHDADAVVLATGYRQAPLPLLSDLVEHDAKGRPVIERDYRLRVRDGGPATLFVQNAELHTHGVGAPDLGLGAHRNAVIANALSGREAYEVREQNVFQTFGVPERPAADVEAA
jgi:lysine N6-hydroxylase